MILVSHIALGVGRRRLAAVVGDDRNGIVSDSSGTHVIHRSGGMIMTVEDGMSGHIKAPYLNSFSRFEGARSSAFPSRSMN
jgi:hypothetical protein